MCKPVVSIEFANGKVVKIELEPAEAPNSVNAFIDLVEKGVFDDREIKRIVPDFVIQPTYTSFERDEVANIAVAGEFRANGFSNSLKLEKKVVGLGGDGKTMAGVSCFFFIMSDQAGERLDGNFTGIGTVIEGWEEIERIERVDTKKIDIGEENVVVNEPIVPQVMKKVTVELNEHEVKDIEIIGLSD